MRPYWTSGDGRLVIYHGDCRDVLPAFDPAGIDLVLTDPPYGINLENHGIANNRRTNRSWRIEGDMDADIGTKVLEWCDRYALATVAFASPARPWAGRWRQYLVWDKGPAVGGGGDPSKCWKQTWELIQAARTGDLFGARDSAVLRYWIRPQDLALHPCQKPVSLLAYLIEKTTPPDALILDPFLGSGSTLVAALRTGRRAIGIEIEERYAEIAARRLSDPPLLAAVRATQGDLFSESAG